MLWDGQYHVVRYPTRNNATPSVNQLLGINDSGTAVGFYNDAKGNAVPFRSIWFDRVDLSIIRQEIYEPNSNIVSDTRYSDWAVFSGIAFPKTISINRPVDGYGVALDLVDMKMNVPVTDKQFELNQPAGSTLQTIGEPASVPPANPKTQK